MSKVKLALSIVEDLRKIADNIETLVKGVSSEENIPRVTRIIAKPITLEKVRAVLAAKSQAGKQPEVKALITKHGGQKLTDLNPSCYEKLLKEAEVL